MHPAHDEIESIASGSFPASSVTPNRVRFSGHVVQERKAEKLRTKVINLEQENQKLKQQLQQMEKLMAMNAAKETKSRDRDSPREEEKKSVDDSGMALTEGQVWNLVRSS